MGGGCATCLNLAEEQALQVFLGLKIHFGNLALLAAVASLQRALVLDPACFICHYNLGNLYWRKKDYAAARDAFSSALDLSPQHDDSRFNLATPRPVTNIPKARITNPSRMTTGEIDSSKAGCK